MAVFTNNPSIIMLQKITEIYDKQHEIDSIHYRLEEIDIRYQYELDEISHKKEIYSKSSCEENNINIARSNYLKCTSILDKNGDKKFHSLRSSGKKRVVQIRNLLLQVRSDTNNDWF